MHGWRWTEPSHWHLTLRFLGPTDEAQRRGWRAALPDLSSVAQPPLDSRGLQAWPNLQQPRVLVVRWSLPVGLRELAEQIEKVAQELGHPPQTRPLMPHSTLARLAANATKPTLYKVAVPAPRFEPIALTLYRSTTDAAGAQHVAVRRLALPEIV